MSKLSNTLLMLTYLQNGKKYSIKELSEKLEVSPRMVRTYKEDLEKAGFIIETIHGPYGGYIMRKNNLAISNQFTDISKDIEKTYNIISRAIKEKRKLEITYNSLGKGLNSRVIHPIELFCIKDSFGLAAYCEVKKDLRHFELKRIEDIKILEEKY